MKSKILGLLAVGLLAGYGVVEASTLTLQPGDGKDAEINNASPNQNSDTLDSVVVNWDGNARSIGLVEFDLSALPTGASITSATLSLFQQFNPCYQCRYDVFRVTSAWNESTVTFSTAPTHDLSVVASLVIQDSSNDVFRDWDITSLVTGWANGSFANYGLWIEEIPVQGNAIAYFASSDAESGFEPRLAIHYTVPEPDTLALLSLGLAGLGLSRRRKAN